MTILVTGATGTVGRQVVEQLAKRGAGSEQSLRRFMPSWMAFDMRLMSERFLTEGMLPEAGDAARLTTLLGRALRSYRDFAAEIATSV
ncbi:hypothetical protein WME81_35575 [Sorangium sp. So ce1078]